MDETQKIKDSCDPGLTGVKKKVVGYLAALCVSFSAAISIVIGQLLGDSVSPFQTNFARFIVQTVIGAMGLMAIRNNPKLPLEWKPVLLMTISVVLTFGAGVLMVIAAWYLPAALVQGLLESCFMTLSAIYAIFHKKCTVDLPFAIVLCYVGCILMIQPPGMFNNNAYKIDHNCTNGSSFNITLIALNNTIESCDSSHGMETLYGVLSVVGVAVCLWGHAQFNVEKLSQWISILAIMFWVGIGCLILSAPVLGILQQPFVTPSGSQVGLELLFGLAFTANIFFIMYAVTLLPMSHVAVVLPSGLVFLYIFQKTLLKNIQPGPDNWIAIFGLILTLLGAILSPTCDIIREKCRRKSNDQEIEVVVKEKHKVDEKTILIHNK